MPNDRLSSNAERARRFVQPRDEVESVREDVERWIGRPLEEKAQASVELCRLAEDILAVRPDRERVLAYQEPPAPDYLSLVRRHRRK